MPASALIGQVNLRTCYQLPNADKDKSQIKVYNYFYCMFSSSSQYVVPPSKSLSLRWSLQINRLQSTFVRSKWRLFGIPWSLGVACLAAVQLVRTVRRDIQSDDQVTWQVSLLCSQTEPINAVFLTLFICVKIDVSTI